MARNVSTSSCVGVRVVLSQYQGEFYRRVVGPNNWRKFGSIGNAGVAEDVADLMRALGHPVSVEVREDEDNG